MERWTSQVNTALLSDSPAAQKGFFLHRRRHVADAITATLGKCVQILFSMCGRF